MTTLSLETPVRLLIADHDPAFREELAETLRQYGCHCECVASADEAQEALHTVAFDALIVDAEMPGNEKLELVEYLSRRTLSLPIVLLTDRPTVEVATRSVRLPVIAYLAKPLDEEELRSILREAVNRHRGNRALRKHRERMADWDRELEDIERRLRTPFKENPAATGSTFVRLTLRNLVLTLMDMEQSISGVYDQNSALEQQRSEFLNALHRAVNALEKTGPQSLSPELGAVHQELQQLLTNHQTA
jgi:DNA-binding response OmpR family regulator